MSHDEKLRRRLEGLVVFLSVFAAPGFVFGTWVNAEFFLRRGVHPSKGSGIPQFPYVDFSPGAVAFIKAAYDLNWVTDGFDWMEWSKTEEAQQLWDNADAIARADPDQLARLLTRSIREDRFVDGALLEDFERGRLTAILYRAERLLQSMTDQT